jgi:hypothetical protein
MLAFSQALQPYLAPGEGLLWTGRPRQGLVLQAMDAFIIPFSLVWASLALTAVFASAHAPPANPARAMPLAMGLLFGAVAFYITIGRFLVDAWQRAHIVYGLTEERAIIVSTGFGTSVTSFDLASLPGLKLIETGNGIGTIELRDAGPYRNAYWYTTSAGSSFFRIDGARQVFELIRQQRAGLKA